MAYRNIGEQISASATAVDLVSATSKTVASITLTPGIWDISAVGMSWPTGGTGLQSVFNVGVSDTTNVLSGTIGIDYVTYSGTSLGLISGSVPDVRKNISASTTYYVVVNSTYSSTTCPANARITATRMG